MAVDLPHLLTRADALLSRLEALLPHPVTAPDWQAAVAWRYRKRGGAGTLEPVRQLGGIRLAALKEVDA